MQPHYQQCKRCILDTRDDAIISFDEKGICSYCHDYEVQEKLFVKTGEEAKNELEHIVRAIKEAGNKKPYDCIIGLSGGVDSTYLAHKAKQLGLRPLAVHFDNGWNSELAVNNIENIVNRLGFDLVTIVIDWEEFRSLQLAFLRASVVDIEMITDHAIIASLYRLALQKNIKFILSGNNVVTEAILPKHWIHRKGDHVQIRSINRIFNNKSLKSYPLLRLSLRVRSDLMGIKSISLLNYIPYNKEEAKKLIINELGWRDYGGKHYESIFTRFYQGYILPKKFDIDKRKAHLSNLICSGQMTREEAIIEIQKPGYEIETQKSDYLFVKKKLGLSESQFQEIMEQPIRKHSDYPVEALVYNRFPILRIVGPLWRTVKKIVHFKW